MTIASATTKIDIAFRPARRVNQSLTASIEKRALQWMAERAPKWLSSDQLTVLGLGAQIGAGICYAAARFNRYALLLVIFFLVLNWFGDSMDGTLARVRRQQRPRGRPNQDHPGLSPGLQAAQDVRRLFNMSCGTEGFFLERHPKLAPVNTFTDGIYIAGCCQGPRDIPDTVAQAGAAAAEALVLIDRGFIEQEPNTAHILEDCCGCKSCLPLCPYTAITFDDATKKAVINEALCKGCGTCVVACPTGAMRQKLFEDQEIFEEIEGILTNA